MTALYSRVQCHTQLPTQPIPSSLLGENPPSISPSITSCQRPASGPDTFRSKIQNSLSPHIASSSLDFYLRHILYTIMMY